MKKKLWKEIIITVLFMSSILSLSPIAHGQTLTVQQSIDAVKMEMKQATLAYVEPALKGKLVPSSSLNPVLKSVKKNYQATKKTILASSLSAKEKQAKMKEIDELYQEKIVKGIIPYIDAYNYATKYLDPLLNEIKEAEAKNDFLAVEKAYHKLSVQLKSRTSILYRFSGKAARDLLLEKYKKTADKTRDEMIVPVTIIMKLTNAQQLYQTGKIEEAKKVLEDIPLLVAELSSTNEFHLALIKELERLQAIFFPTPITPPSVSSGDNSGSSETSAQRALRLAKTNAIIELTNYKVEADYSTANWSIILDLKTTGKNTINSSKTTTEVTQALVNAKAEIDKVLTTVQEMSLAKEKTDAIAVLANYKVNVKNDYSSTNWTKIEGFKADGVIAIKASTTTAAVAQALTDAKTKIDTVNTLVQDQDLVIAEAAKIALYQFFGRVAGTVHFPTVGADYTISVKATSDPSKYDMDGKVQADGKSNVIYTVKHTASGKTADTGQVVVSIRPIPKYSVPIVIGSSTSEVMPKGGTVEFTFTDDPQWRAAIFSITYGVDPVDNVDKTTPGILVVNNGTSFISGTFVWKIKAKGYSDTIVTIELK